MSRTRYHSNNDVSRWLPRTDKSNSTGLVVLLIRPVTFDWSRENQTCKVPWGRVVRRKKAKKISCYFSAPFLLRAFSIVPRSGALLTRHCDWSRPSSTPTSPAKCVPLVGSLGLTRLFPTQKRSSITSRNTTKTKRRKTRCELPKELKRKNVHTTELKVFIPPPIFSLS